MNTKPKLSELFFASAAAADPMRSQAQAQMQQGGWSNQGTVYAAGEFEAARTMSRILYAIGRVYEAHEKADDSAQDLRST